MCLRERFAIMKWWHSGHVYGTKALLCFTSCAFMVMRCGGASLHDGTRQRLTSSRVCATPLDHDERGLTLRACFCFEPKRIPRQVIVWRYARTEELRWSVFALVVF